MTIFINQEFALAYMNENFDNQVKKYYDQIIPGLEKQLDKKLNNVPELIIGGFDDFLKINEELIDNYMQLHVYNTEHREVERKMYVEVMRDKAFLNYLTLTATYVHGENPKVFVRNDCCTKDNEYLLPRVLSHELVHGFQYDKFDLEKWNNKKSKELAKKNGSIPLSDLIMKTLVEGEAEFESFKYLVNNKKLYDERTLQEVIISVKDSKNFVKDSKTKGLLKNIDKNPSKFNIYKGRYVQNIPYQLGLIYFKAKKFEGLKAQEIRNNVPSNLYKMLKIARKDLN